MSEATFLIWSLDQREDWAVIICLVGGGQEINTGEAGISEWINALNTQFQHWNVYISNKLTEPEYAEGKVNELLENNTNVTYSNDLHLSVSMRSFRAESLSNFIHSLLSFNTDAIPLYNDIQQKGYPIFLTRNIETARMWLRKNARGTQQTGILVSKVAARFKPQAVNVIAQGDENAVHWFLEDKTDIRSSNALEDTLTEFKVQGLEIDWACVAWDADLRLNKEQTAWQHHQLRSGTKWQNINKPINQQYQINAYRVLLTRARQGMVIVVPNGDNGVPPDETRKPEWYDGIYSYLKEIGIKEIL